MRTVLAIMIAFCFASLAQAGHPVVTETRVNQPCKCCDVPARAYYTQPRIVYQRPRVIDRSIMVAPSKVEIQPTTATQETRIIHRRKVLRRRVERAPKLRAPRQTVLKQNACSGATGN